MNETEIEMEEKEIEKPCPFCGSYDIDVEDENNGGYSIYYCKCNKCGARSGSVLEIGGEDTISLAIEKWDTRNN